MCCVDRKSGTPANDCMHMATERSKGGMIMRAHTYMFVYFVHYIQLRRSINPVENATSCRDGIIVGELVHSQKKLGSLNGL